MKNEKWWYLIAGILIALTPGFIIMYENSTSEKQIIEKPIKQAFINVKKFCLEGIEYYVVINPRSDIVESLAPVLNKDTSLVKTCINSDLDLGE